MRHGLRRISPSSSAVLKIARSSRHALAAVTSLTPASSSFLRQRRTHPDLVLFDQLPEHEKQKDRLFMAIVRALSPEPKLTADSGDA